MLKASNQSIRMGMIALGAILLGACDAPQLQNLTIGVEEHATAELGQFAELGGKADGLNLPQFDPSFPAIQDLAVLLPMDVDPPILGELPTQFDRKLLSREWVDEVSAAFGPTDIGPGFSSENSHEDWQLVSMRIAPCGLGSFPGELPEGVCWPQVRLVWQPVIANHHTGWMYVDTYETIAQSTPSTACIQPMDERIDPALQMMQEILASPEGSCRSTPLSSMISTVRGTALFSASRGKFMRCVGTSI